MKIVCSSFDISNKKGKNKTCFLIKPQLLQHNYKTNKKAPVNQMAILRDYIVPLLQF